MDDDAAPERASFPSTQWSLVLEAANPAHPGAAGALRSLLARYWRPLLAHLRHPRWALSREDALDLVQEFCLSILEKPEAFLRVTPEKGHFRHYVKGAINHFMLDERRAQRAAKRGGGAMVLSIDMDHADIASLEGDAPTPDAQLERAWALTVLDEATSHMKAELEATGKLAYYHVFRLSFDEQLSYRDIASHLGLTEQEVTNYLHRARQHFGRALIAVVLPTVEGLSAAREEVQELMAILGRGGAAVSQES